ncbi:MAG: response regulator [Bacteroidota bacterium]
MESPAVNVLIIDDDIAYVRIAQMHLKKYQGRRFNIVWKEDGAKGLEELEHNPGIDVILMDYFLPQMNGSEITKTIRSRNINTPIIFLTSNKDFRLAVEVMKLGVEDYLIKEEMSETILPSTLLSVLERVKLKRQIEAVEKNKLITQKRAEAIKELIVTICHEFNNPLAAIKISTDIVARQKLSSDDRKLIDELDQNISIMEDEINKLKNIAFDKIDLREHAAKKKNSIQS